MIELFKEIWTTVQHNKLRTALTGFAVGWGIFILIFLLGAGNGLINAQMKQSEEFLKNSMVVYGGWTTKPHAGFDTGRRIQLDNKDLQATSTAFSENIMKTGASLYKGSVVLRLGANYMANQTIEGTYPMRTEIDKIIIVHGRFINDIDIKERRKVIVLSQTQAKELLREGDALLGRDIIVNESVFRVVGITKDDSSSSNNVAYAPFTTISTIYNYGHRVDRIEFSVAGLATAE